MTGGDPEFFGSRLGRVPEWDPYWGMLSEEFGRGFPEDYKILSERFGGFELSHFISVNSPDALVAQNFELQHTLNKRPWNSIQVQEGQGFTGRGFQGGEIVYFSDVVQWADTDSDYVLCWNAVGNPGSWNVLVTDFFEWKVFPVGVLEFLEMLIESEVGREVCRGFGWPDLGPVIDPFCPE